MMGNLLFLFFLFRQKAAQGDRQLAQKGFKPFFILR